MKRLLYTLRSDFLGLRWWLAVWIGVLVTQVACGFGILRIDFGENVEAERAMAKFCDGLFLADGVLVYVVTVLLVQEKYLGGAQKATVALPESGIRLLLGKTVGATVIFGIVPAALCLPWWLAAGLDGPAIAAVAVETFCINLTIALPATLVAACVATMAGALWLALGVAAAVAVVVQIWIGSVSGPFAEVADCGPWAIVGTGILACATVIALFVRFARQEFRSSLAWLALGLVVMFGIGLCWPWKLQILNEWTERNPERASDITMTFHRVKIMEEPRRYNRLWVEMSLIGAGKDLDRVKGLAAAHVCRWPDSAVEIGYLDASFFHHGENDRPLRDALNLGAPKPDRETSEWGRRHGESYARTAYGPSAATPLFSTWLQWEEPWAGRIRRDPPTYEARAWFTLGRLRLTEELPLEPGRRISFGTGAIKVRSVERRGNGVYATYIESQAMSTALGLAGAMFQALPLSTPDLYLLNRTRGEFLPMGTMHRWPARIKGVEIRQRSDWVLTENVVRAGRWTSDFESWLRDASFALVRFDEEAIFYRDVKVDRLVVNESNRAAIVGPVKN